MQLKRPQSFFFRYALNAVSGWTRDHIATEIYVKKEMTRSRNYTPTRVDLIRIWLKTSVDVFSEKKMMDQILRKTQMLFGRVACSMSVGYGE